jgi:16S rRNA (adenine1518-N6/adenine1519-N6)-dimethyltransferase
VSEARDRRATGPTGSQVTLARMREFGIRPDRDLGQHFLLDDNVLEVAGRLLPLSDDDVVVEVGAGLGVLTAWLARRVAFVHAVEIDRRLEPALAATLAGAENVHVVWADAARLDLGALDPPPGVLVANLPYNVATPVIVRALPAIREFCVMVQREIADRLFAQPGTKAYGAVSVLVQLACERIGRRPVSRRVFAPEPNVDSALIAFRRRPGAAFGEEWEWTSRVVHAAFAHRRKTLANSLALSGLPAPPAELAGLRAEQLPPERLAQLARELR